MRGRSPREQPGRRLAPAALLLMLAGCAGAPATFPRERLTGSWRAVLDSPGGELPFTLEIFEDHGRLAAVAVNGAERAPFSGVEISETSVELSFDWYDAEIRANLTTAASEAGSERLDGRWRKTVPGGDSVLGFQAVRNAPGQPSPPRFAPLAAPASAATDPRPPASIAGSWALEFTDEEGTSPARGEFDQRGQRVTGSILTPTGDYRFLDGSYEAGRLRLSTFDGAHAFLFSARVDADGTVAGHFWSRDTYHATWTGRRVAADQQVLPDAWELVGLTDEAGRFDFRFPDLDGEPVSLADERFRGKVVLVNIFGSWCPNCNDKAPLLASWQRRYGDRGLEIVGLAYELTGDPARDGEQVRRFAERHGVGYPLLLAGTSDKQEAAATLPDLSGVVAFPTTVFVGRDGRARRVHSGFAGPGTGPHYERLVAELERLIEELLTEPAGQR